MELILFANDTNIFMSDRCLDSLTNTISAQITYIFKWSKINKLSLNIKNHFMLFGNKRIRKMKPIKLYIDNILVLSFFAS